VALISADSLHGDNIMPDESLRYKAAIHALNTITSEGGPFFDPKHDEWCGGYEVHPYSMHDYVLLVYLRQRKIDLPDEWQGVKLVYIPTQDIRHRANLIVGLIRKIVQVNYHYGSSDKHYINFHCDDDTNLRYMISLAEISNNQMMIGLDEEGYCYTFIIHHNYDIIQQSLKEKK
jgi:hypothetical protein